MAEPPRVDLSPFAAKTAVSETVSANLASRAAPETKRALEKKKAALIFLPGSVLQRRRLHAVMKKESVK